MSGSSGSFIPWRVWEVWREGSAQHHARHCKPVPCIKSPLFLLRLSTAYTIIQDWLRPRSGCKLFRVVWGRWSWNINCVSTVASLCTTIKAPHFLATSAFGLAPHTVWSFSSPAAYQQHNPTPYLILLIFHPYLLKHREGVRDRWYFNLTSTQHNTVDISTSPSSIQLWIACNHCVVLAILELYFRRLGL